METIQSALHNRKMNPFGQDSITLKLLITGLLVLALLIPASWIHHLIDERQKRATDVIKEITRKWSDSQTVTGPVLSLPYRYTDMVTRSTGEKETVVRTSTAFFLPERVSVNGKIDPQKLHRGLFEAVVYSSDLDIAAYFAPPDLMALQIDAEQVDWEGASLLIGITDLEGISSQPIWQSGTTSLSAEPTSSLPFSVFAPPISMSDSELSEKRNSAVPSSHGLAAGLGWKSADDFTSEVSISLALKGSHALHVVPAGKETSVHLAGAWNNPSFDGAFLPAHREVGADGFTADWKILHYNRPFQQQWIGKQEFADTSFGLRLLIPVDQYQQSIRTAKYAHLIIVLTFVALFLLEITQKLRIHPFQYILIGAALIIYYTLLLSFSEQMGFTVAYWIATGATVALVSLYAKSFLGKVSTAVLFASLLATSYAFIFVIILQQDLSLLIGSVGLFIALAALMFFSRKIVWYKELTKA